MQPIILCDTQTEKKKGKHRKDVKEFYKEIKTLEKWIKDSERGQENLKNKVS